MREVILRNNSSFLTGQVVSNKPSLRPKWAKGEENEALYRELYNEENYPQVSETPPGLTAFFF